MRYNRSLIIVFFGGALLFFFLCQIVAAGSSKSVIDLPRTGQTNSDVTGDDGDLQMGVQWPDPRFTDNGNGTVTDHLTGLIWLQDANCFGLNNWMDAIGTCNNLADGQCGLTDGSFPGDWRLPNIRELFSLIDFSRNLPLGHPFTLTDNNYYWSSTSVSYNFEDGAWCMWSGAGHVNPNTKNNTYAVWPVRNVISHGATFIIQAENYNQGGQRVGYFDRTPGNKGGQYRDDDVDIWKCGKNTYYTGANATNEWLKYTIDIPYPGEYYIRIRVATPKDNRSVHIEFDGVDKTGCLTVPNTGGWITWQTLSDRVLLTEGQCVMRLVIDNGGLNIDQISMEYIGY